MGKPAARVGDPVGHTLPPVLTGGPGSPTVLIGGMPAWRGVPAATASALQSARQTSDAGIQTAEAASQAATGTPGQGAAMAAEKAAKLAAASAMAAAITSAAAGADLHNCTTLLPDPAHGPGVVTNGSTTVLINGLPAAREGDTILEGVGPAHQVKKGCPTVQIGG